jgi:hypothetical protein
MMGLRRPETCRVREYIWNKNIKQVAYVGNTYCNTFCLQGKKMAYGRAETCHWEKLCKNILVITTFKKECLTIFTYIFCNSAQHNGDVASESHKCSFNLYYKGQISDSNKSITRPRPTALLPPRSNGKPRGCYCSCWTPDDEREDARNMLSCT